MKKLIIAAIIAVCITFTGMAVNYFSFQKTEYLKLCLRNHGGEITIEQGFGLRAVHLYGMEMGSTATHSLRFDPVSLIVTLLLAGGLAFIILFAAERIRNR